MTCKDIYILAASDPFRIDGREEVTVNLNLKKRRPCYQTLLTGCVCGRCSPLFKATVVVFDNRFRPFSHAETNERGLYELRNVLKPGEYYVVAKAFGYKTSRVKKAKIKRKRMKILSFELEKKCAYSNSFF